VDDLELAERIGRVPTENQVNAARAALIGYRRLREEAPARIKLIAAFPLEKAIPSPK
jgi:hypothetical protein